MCEDGCLNNIHSLKKNKFSSSKFKLLHKLVILDVVKNLREFERILRCAQNDHQRNLELLSEESPFNYRDILRCSE